MLKNRKMLLFQLGVLSAFGSISIDMYLPGLPTLARYFHTSALATQLTLASFFVGFALGQLFFGPVSDRFGRRKPLFFGIFIYIIASLGCAFVPSIKWLIILRFFQGLGACSGTVISKAVVRDSFPSAEAPHVFATLILIMGVVPILAPLVGGYILVYASWQAIFWVLTCFGVMILLATQVYLPETHSPTLVHSLAVQNVVSRYLQIASDKSFMGFASVYSLSFAGLFAYIAGAPFVFIDLYHIPDDLFGWIFGTNALGLITLSQANRLLHRYFCTIDLLRIGVAAQIISGFALFLATATGFLGIGGVMIPLFIYVSSIGLVGPNAISLAMAPHALHAGSASALLGFLQFFVASLAALSIGMLQFDSALPIGIAMFVFSLLASFILWMVLKVRTSQKVGTKII